MRLTTLLSLLIFMGLFMLSARGIAWKDTVGSDQMTYEEDASLTGASAPRPQKQRQEESPAEFKEEDLDKNAVMTKKKKKKKTSR